MFCIYSRTALYLSCQNGYTAVASYLIDIGADVNAVEQGKNTPLILGSQYGYLDVVKLLIMRKATIGHKGDKGLVHILLGMYLRIINSAQRCSYIYPYFTFLCASNSKWLPINTQWLNTY